MHITAGTSVKLRCDTAHEVFYELQIGIVGFNLQVERTLWFYGIYVAVYMALGNVFLADMGIKIDTFHFMMPFSVNIGIPQQAVIQSETSDEKIGVHDGFLQYSAGIGRTGSFALEVDSKIGNVEHVTYINVFQIQADRIFGLLREDAVDAEMPVLMAEIEVVDMYLPGVNDHL